MIAYAITTVLFGTVCLVSDMFTRTAIWHTDPMEGTTMSDRYLDPQDTSDYWEHYMEVVQDEYDRYEDIQPDLDGWDDVEGIDVDGFASDEVTLTESVEWLHSLLYSDYADPSDDDDRAGMDIPRSVLDQL